MTTSLDKQAREFWDGWLNIWLQEHPAILPNSVVAISFAAAFATQVREQSKWVSVAERLPDDDHTVIVCHWNGDTYVHVAAYYRQFGEWRKICDHGRKFKGKVTHWQPLPAPPQTTEQEER